MATVVKVPEGRVALYDVSWSTYESLLADLGENSGVRLAYDRGTLEIISPSVEHERLNRTLNLLVEILASERGIDIENVGSMTVKRKELGGGFEPDSSFYVQNAERVRGKSRIDAEVDPPPDLMIKIEITHALLEKLPLYAAMGIPEIWRYDGERLRIFHLQEREYVERSKSLAFPGLAARTLSNLLAESKTERRSVWLKMLREWAAGNRSVD